MPVYKFRTLDAARKALWMKPNDPRLPELVRRIWTMADEWTLRYPRPAGVKKFRSLEAAQAAREEWERERSAWLSARDSAKG